MTPERLADLRRFIDSTNCNAPASELLAEVDRLRMLVDGAKLALADERRLLARRDAALVVVADPNRWKVYMDGGFEWRGTGEFADPMAFARAAMEGVEDEA